MTRPRCDSWGEDGVHRQVSGSGRARCGGAALDLRPGRPRRPHLLCRPTRVSAERGAVRGPPAAGPAGDLGPARARGPRPRDLPALAGRGRPAPPPRLRLGPGRRAGRRLAGAVAEASPAPASLVVEHAHHLGGPATSAAAGPVSPALLGALVDPLLEEDRACIVISDAPLPAGALPARGATVTADDLRLGPGAAGELLGREAPRLPAAAARRVASLCRGATADLVAVCGAAATLGPAVVAQAADQAAGVEDLLAHLAVGLLAGTGADSHRALALALEVGYSHPALSAAVLGQAAAPPAGPWLQPLADGWSTLRTGWRDPLRAALAPARPLGAETVHRAADYLVDRGAAERAVPLYLELEDADCAAGAAAGPVATLAPPHDHDRPGWEPDGHLLSVHLLGQLKVRLDDVAVDDWPS